MERPNPINHRLIANKLQCNKTLFIAYCNMQYIFKNHIAYLQFIAINIFANFYIYITSITTYFEIWELYIFIHFLFSVVNWFVISDSDNYEICELFILIWFSILSGKLSHDFWCLLFWKCTLCDKYWIFQNNLLHSIYCIFTKNLLQHCNISICQNLIANK